MRKGRETKTCAMTTAVVVKAMSRPAPLRSAPRVERLQRDAGDDGRQRERQGDEDAGGAHAPPGAGQHEGGGDTEEEVDAEGRGARAQRQAQGVASLGRRERRAEGSPVDAPQHEGQGQEQEAQGERADAPRPDGQGADGGRPA